MKWMLSLLLAMLIASPALGQFTREEAKILLDASARMTADIETIKAELVELKTEVALVKAEVAAVKTELTLVKAEVAAVKTDVAELKTELTVVKTDVAELKTDVALVKSELGMLKVEVADLKTEVQHLDDKLDLVANTATGTQSEVRGNSTRTSELHSQMNSQTHALLLVAGLLATVLLWMLKKEWDARREERAKNAEQEKENAALRAENERLRNASGLVSSTGGKLEVD